jgi:hypothetical protein
MEAITVTNRTERLACGSPAPEATPVIVIDDLLAQWKAVVARLRADRENVLVVMVAARPDHGPFGSSGTSR